MMLHRQRHASCAAAIDPYLHVAKGMQHLLSHLSLAESTRATATTELSGSVSLELYRSSRANYETAEKTSANVTERADSFTKRRSAGRLLHLRSCAPHSMSVAAAKGDWRCAASAHYTMQCDKKLHASVRQPAAAANGSH